MRIETFLSYSYVQSHYIIAIVVYSKAVIYSKIMDGWIDECLPLSDEVRVKISKTEYSFFHLPCPLPYSVCRLIPIRTKKENVSGFR